MINIKNDNMKNFVCTLIDLTVLLKVYSFISFKFDDNFLQSLNDISKVIE